MNRTIGGALAALRAVPESVSPESVSTAARAGSRTATNLEGRSAIKVASIPALALALLLAAGAPCSAQDGDLLVRPFEDQRIQRASLPNSAFQGIPDWELPALLTVRIPVQ